MKVVTFGTLDSATMLQKRDHLPEKSLNCAGRAEVTQTSRNSREKCEKKVQKRHSHDTRHVWEEIYRHGHPRFMWRNAQQLTSIFSMLCLVIYIYPLLKRKTYV